MVLEIDHMSDLNVDSSFYKQSMKIDNFHKITERLHSSIGQSINNDSTIEQKKT